MYKFSFSPTVLVSDIFRHEFLCAFSCLVQEARPLVLVQPLTLLGIVDTFLSLSGLGSTIYNSRG